MQLHCSVHTLKVAVEQNSIAQQSDIRPAVCSLWLPILLLGGHNGQPMENLLMAVIV